jgi:hypothetical protein
VENDAGGRPEAARKNGKIPEVVKVNNDRENFCSVGIENTV